MKLLHTSDWHVGKSIRGHSRIEEHRSVLGEIVEYTSAHAVDAVLIAGDLFDSSAPAPAADALVYQTLLDLAETGAHVAVIAGNHDNPKRLSAVRRLLALGRVQMVAEPLRPNEGSVTHSVVGDERLTIASLPFVSQRSIVRAADLMTNAGFEHTGAYADRLRALIDALSSEFSSTSVNVLLAHAFVLGGTAGGGERPSHIIDEYAVPSTVFPTTATYVALGHLHRSQKIPGPTALHYSGSPLQLDFSDTEPVKHVNLVDAKPGAPAAVTRLPIRGGRSLRTVSGTIAELGDYVDNEDDAWLRVRVAESRRAGLADEIRVLFGERVVQVLIDAPSDDPRPSRPSRAGQSPRELFGEYLGDRNIDDPRLERLFDELLDVEESVN